MSMTMIMHTSITTIMTTIMAMIMAMITRLMRTLRRRNLTIRDRCGCAKSVKPGRHDYVLAP